MNRIILIGNGFDLAHGLKTSYRDFIDWFWEKSINGFIKDYVKGNYFWHGKNSYGHDSDTISSENELLTFSVKFKIFHKESGAYAEEAEKNIYISSAMGEKTQEILNKNLSLQDRIDIEKEIIIRWREDNLKKYENYSIGGNVYKVTDYVAKVFNVHVDCKNKFLKIISENLSLQNWVDIEDEYYKLLQEIINKKIPDDKKNYTNIKQLNDEFSRIKKELTNYLIEETTKGIGGNAIEFVNTTIDNNIYSDFESKDLTEHANSSIPDSFLFLSFNYSNTEKLYVEQFHDLLLGHERETIHIHGELKKTKNPIIFGYGDEIGKEYEEIENLNDNNFLENIKSIRYSDTNNYKRLLDYIDSDKYQIFLFGHSCGLSDRTLLNTLFEHKNCVSIKPFYHKKEDCTDNYSDIVRNISRHFKDKAMMRKKVVNKEYCKPLS